MPTDAEMDYLEKLFGDAYRKEIDQEENVWRTLPFFAATLAVQLAGLAQVRDWVGSVGGWRFSLACVLLAVVAIATLAAVAFLAESIWPADFKYVTREPEFQEFLNAFREQMRAAGASPEQAALQTVERAKSVLVRQYASGAAHNRAINQRRASRRTRAGLATLTSVLSVLALVGLVVVTTLHG